VAAMIGDLDIGNQQMQRIAVLGFPDHLFVQELAAARAQQFDDAFTMGEIDPKAPGVEQIQLVALVAEQIAKPPVVKQNASIVVDHAHSRRAVVEDFAKLPLLLHDLKLVLGQGGDVIDPQHALAADEADVAAAVGDLRVAEQQIQKLARLGAPDHPLVEKLAALLAQRSNNAGALLEVMPEQAGVKPAELVFRITQKLAQTCVVKQQTAVLVHDQQCCGTEFEDFAELPLVFGRLGAGGAAAVGCRRMTCCRVQRHRPQPGCVSETVPLRSIEFEARQKMQEILDVRWLSTGRCQRAVAGAPRLGRCQIGVSVKRSRKLATSLSRAAGS
jgi:hypothetical protein